MGLFMKTIFTLLQISFGIGLALGTGWHQGTAMANDVGGAITLKPGPTAIPWSQLGATAAAASKSSGLAVVPTASGAKLRCSFQRLEGEATREGLWLSSTVRTTESDRFRVLAVAMGRAANLEARREGGTARRLLEIKQLTVLSTTGTVSVDGQLARFVRPNLIEEYSVSLDGVKQDYLVREGPDGGGELVVRLAVSGAKLRPAALGVRLVLDKSGREIAYSRLRATDATGRELNAQMEVVAATDPAGESLALIVEDAGAVYPVRIDPTFSDANWISMGGFPGANGEVFAIVTDESGNLYVGGNFTIIGEIFANRIARWDGNSWASLGSGMNNEVRALAVSGSNIYAGGRFTLATNNGGGMVLASRIARWNGNSWTNLGQGLNNEVHALMVSGSEVYAGGLFTTAGGVSANYIAKWNGNNWTNLAAGMAAPSSPAVYALAGSGNGLYAAGNFKTAGGIEANHVAKWNGINWTNLGLGLNSPANALALSGTEVYVGGQFTRATNTGGAIITVNRMAKWNGSVWSPLSSGLNGTVQALTLSGSSLYAGGQFTTAGGNSASYAAKWDGSIWSSLGASLNNAVNALAVSGGDLFVGGRFTWAGGKNANSIAKWDGNDWSALALGRGINGRVLALVVSGTEVFAGGRFTAAGGNPATNIAKWDGCHWSAVGTGVDGGVGALAVAGNDLYAGGDFPTAGGSTVNFIAKWDGSSWSALGSGMDSAVFALAVAGSNLYAGGQFMKAGGQSAYYVAKWNGSSWSALGSGMFGSPYTYVFALAVWGGDLYAGGIFTSAGGVAANYIARWNGSSWSALGSGVSGGFPQVSALLVSGSDLYVGGGFTTAGINPANNIAKWNGSSWQALGSGVDNFVYALGMAGTNVYAGGAFVTAGGNAAHHIAKWDGSNWSALGAGVNATVLTLAVAGDDLYAGSDFNTAGGKVSAYMARAYLPSLPTLSVRGSGSDAVVTWPTAESAGFVLEQSASLATPIDWATNLNTVTDDGTNKSLIIPATNGAQFFRLRRP